MYICYLDESGTVEPEPKFNHFVLTGIAIPSETWKDKDTKITAIKRRLGLHEAEIHSGWMNRRYVEQEKIADFTSLSHDERRRAVKKERDNVLIRAAALNPKKLKSVRTNFRKTENYVHLTLAERQNVLDQVASEIGSWGDARLFGEAINKDVFAGDTFDQAFSQVVTRFNTFLVNRGNALEETLHGILVQDNNDTVAGKLTQAMRQYHRQGTLWSTIDRIVETPLFVDSQLTSMVQVADLVAYSTRRFFEKGEERFSIDSTADLTETEGCPVLLAFGILYLATPVGVRCAKHTSLGLFDPPRHSVSSSSAFRIMRGSTRGFAEEGISPNRFLGVQPCNLREDEIKSPA